tara:strand:- start:345 stop:653 length:309 start_codon:yes stop_codon:yes gene_type:complete
MGIFGQIRQTIIINFLSNRTNLTLVQYVLYLIIGYIMSQYLDWTKMIIMFILLFGIQWMTRIKAVADGMVFKELIEHHDMNANEIVQKMKDEAEKMNKEDLN